MPSLACLCATGMPLLSSIFLLSVLLCPHVGVQGASLWEPHQRDDDPETFRPGSRAPPPPSAAMLQALQHIQRLSKQAADTSDSVEGAERVGDPPGDMERVRAMLRLATPAGLSARTWDLRGEGDGTGGQGEREGDSTQQLIEALLSTLQQANKAASPQEDTHTVRGHSISPHTASHSLSSLSPPPTQEQDRQADATGIPRHDWKFPLLFENKEGQVQPLKRTNENAEEQYTPQKLATLQSVFEELSQFANSKAYNKRQNDEDDDGNNINEDYDWSREKKWSLGMEKGKEEQTPLEEQTELEEEETRRRQFTGGFGNSMDEEDEETSDGEEDDEVKRSNRLDSESDLLQMEKEEPDDVSRLVDYYLFKVLERTEQEKQKREEEQEREEEEDEEEEEEEEEENNEEQEGREEEDEQRETEKRAAQPWYRDSQSLRQLIKISQKLQIPPEELVDLLESKESRTPDGLWQRMQGQSQPASPRYPSPLSSRKSPVSVLYPQPPQTPELSSVTRDILRILGLTKTEQPGSRSFPKSNQYKPSQAMTYSKMEQELPDYVLPESGGDRRRADYEDDEDDDGLSSYLLAELLRQRQTRTSPALELALRNLLDSPGMSVLEKRQAEWERTAADSDQDTLLGILQYLNLGSDDTDETDLNEKMVPGM